MNKPLCPICHRSLHGSTRAEWPDFPFCSARCRLIDLGRWLGGEYAIAPPAEEEMPSSSETGLGNR